MAALLASGPLAEAQISTRIDQYMHDPAIINPAAMNSYSRARANVFYNRLYSGVNGSPQNMLLSLSVPVNNRRVGVGGYFGQETIGFTTVNNVYGSYAYTIPLGPVQRISVAASLGLLNQKFNGGAIDIVDQNDPVYQNYLRGQSASRLDVKFSALFQVPGLMLGFSSGRLTNPRFGFENGNSTTFYTLKNISSLFGSARIQVSDGFMLQPAASATFTDYKKDIIQYGLNFWFANTVWTGVHHAGNKNLALQIGTEIKNTFMAGYSFSMPMTAQARQLGAGHEVFLSFRFGQVHDANSDMERLVLGGSEANSGYVRNERDRPEREDRENTGNSSKPSGKNERTRVNTPVSVASLTAMKALHNNQDTSTLTLSELSRENPESGFYVVAGMNKSEAQVDNIIKGFYMNGIRSYKFFNPKNGYYYVYLTRRSSKAEADQIKFEGVQGIDNIWTTEIQ
jgi:type IX secretion system PorP/SprF family membrane protein